MNLIVHLFLASSIRRIVRRETGERLNWIGFLYGNILPDLARRFDSIPHYMEPSLQYVSEAAAALSEQYEPERRSFAYSMNMGVVSHYVSDYFCYPHTKLFSGGFFEHMWYETRMTFRYRKARAQMRGPFPGAVPSADLCSHLRHSTHRYGMEPIDCMRDIAYAIECASAVVSGVVAESVSIAQVPLAAAQI